jgi:hypothetical protein
LLNARHGSRRGLEQAEKAVEAVSGLQKGGRTEPQAAQKTEREHGKGDDGSPFTWNLVDGASAPLGLRFIVGWEIDVLPQLRFMFFTLDKEALSGLPKRDLPAERMPDHEWRYGSFSFG